MPALIIGGVTIPGVVAARRTVVEAVERDRAYANNLLATQIAAEKDEWAIEVSHVTVAELATIEAALAGTPPITCSGDLLGGSVSCHVQKNSTDPVLGILPARRMLSFSLLEA